MTIDTNRQITDRRTRPTRFLSRYTFRGQRRSRRRDTDPGSFYVDRIEGRVLGILIAVLAFHVLDAVFTLYHLGRGARELNPLMDALIQIDPSVFVATKLTITTVGLACLGLHQNFPLVRTTILGLFVFFGALVGYHLLLLG